MSLLSDLEALDLRQIVEARGTITVSLTGGGVAALLDADTISTALGDLGDPLSLLSGLDDPQALVGPLLGAFAGLAGELGIDDFPLSAYVDAVRDGAEILADLLGAGGEPVLERLIAAPLSGVQAGAEQAMAGFVRIGGRELDRFSTTVTALERGAPTDPAQLARLAVEALVPAGAGTLGALRGALDDTLAASLAISLPATRTSGLVAAFDAVAEAALRADDAAVQRALRELAAARQTTLASLRGDLLRCFEAIDVLPLATLTDALGDARTSLRAGSEGILELLDGWRLELVEVRAQLAGADPQVLLDELPALFTMLEDLARVEIVEPIEAQATRLEQWLRDLLGELPLTELRAEVSRVIHDVARRVDDADLGRFAADARSALRAAADALALPDLATPVQAAIEDVAATLGEALGGIEDGLAAIGPALEAIAAQAQQVLEPVVAALASFRSSLDELTQAIDSLGIEQAGEEIVRRLTELRQSVEELLSGTALPEPVRPLVEQLVGVLEGLDIDEHIGKPISDAAAELRVPDEVRETMTRALQAARTALDNVIPAQLIASIEQEIEDGLRKFTTFDAATLLPGVSAFFDEAAATVRGLDPRTLLGPIGEQFEQLLVAFDELHPRRLLAPVITAYDELLGAVPAPAPADGARQAADLMQGAGDATGRALAQPALRAAGSGALELREPGAAAPPAAPPPAVADVRPGDIVRLLGYVPTKLREALQALAAGPAGEVVAAIDALTGGLARDLRALQGALYGVDERLRGELDGLLAPVGAAQARAGLALRASFELQAGGGAASLDLGASLDVLALHGPGPLRADLGGVEEQARGRAREHASGLGAAPLAAAADVLEQSRLGALGGDLDALLAALDLEPLAAEIDALAATALTSGVQWMTAVGSELEAAVNRLQQLLRDLNPASQAHRYLRLLGVLREQLDLLDPARLADELGEIHAAVRATLAAYDPLELAGELGSVIEDVATTLEELDPAALLGDLDPLAQIRQRVEAINPAAAFAGISDELSEIGEALAALDPGAMLDAVNALGPRVAEQLTRVVDSVRDEIVALLESLRFASAGASASIEVTA